MKLLRLALASAVTLLTLAARSQTAEEIVAKHIDALGGKEKISQINSIYLENSIEVMGNQAPSTTVILNGKGFKNEVDFNGQKIVQCLTNSSGWSINPMAGQNTATAMTDDQVKAGQDQLYVGGALFNYAQKGSKVEFLGKENVDSVSALKLKLTSKAKVETTYYLDPASFYVIKTISKIPMNGEDVETTSLFSNYKKTDFGFVMPFKTELHLPQGFTITSNTNKVEINKPVDESVFKAK